MCLLSNVWVLARLCETKIWGKTKLCYMDTSSFIVYIKTEDIYSVIAKYIEARPLDRPLPRGINKKVIGLVKNKLRKKVMTELKMYSYLTYDSDKNDKEKRTKKCVVINCFDNSF